MTRDFACKILELLARRKSRAPAVVVGESHLAPNVGRLPQPVWIEKQTHLESAGVFQWKNYEELIDCFSSDSPWCLLLKKCLQTLWSGVDQLKEFSGVSDHTNLHVNCVFSVSRFATGAN